jgi:hypothetical protein
MNADETLIENKWLIGVHQRPLTLFFWPLFER